MTPLPPQPTPLIQPCAMPAVTVAALGILALFMLPGGWKLLSLAAIPLAMGKSLECMQ